MECYINAKKIVGVVKRKEEAAQEYQEAVERGEGAYLAQEGKNGVLLVFTVEFHAPPMNIFRRIYFLFFTLHRISQRFLRKAWKFASKFFDYRCSKICMSS